MIAEPFIFLFDKRKSHFLLKEFSVFKTYKPQKKVLVMIEPDNIEKVVEKMLNG